MIVPRTAGVHRLVGPFGFLSFVLRCALTDPCLACVSTLSQSPQVLGGYVSLLISLHFCQRSSTRLGGRFRHVTRAGCEQALGEFEIFLARDVVWSVAWADRSSMADAVDHVCLSQTTNTKVLDI